MPEQMTTLDKIEARVKKTWKAAELGSANNVFVAPVDLEETLFLIRAVRQWHARAKYLEPLYLDNQPVPDMDDDVLALLEDNDAQA